MQKNNKTCSSCKKYLSMKFFYKSSVQSGGFQAFCKDCNRKYMSEYYHKKISKDIEKRRLSSRSTRLKSKYNITIEQYNQMLENQNHTCAICNKKETQRSNPKGNIDNLRVDHCHTSGLIRGLLCSKCNFGIANFNDSLETITSALHYILIHRQKLKD